MIFNLVKYLKNQLPIETIYANQRIGAIVPDRNIIVRETGGPVTPWSRWVHQTAQIIARDFDPVKCKVLSESVYTLLHRQYGLILPEETAGTTTYAALTTAQITAIQKPYPLGVDDEGRTEYVNNYEIFYEEAT